MPQAADDLRAKMQERFGDEVDDAGPINYLKEKGFTLRRDWSWEKENINSLDQLSQEEYECILFLIQEWDFGGLYTGE